MENFKNQIRAFSKASLYRNQMNAAEQRALLSDLIAAVTFELPSELLNCLLNDDFESFREQCKNFNDFESIAPSV